MIIDSIYCINLNQHVEKWEHIVTKFAYNGMEPPTRIEAVDKDNIDSETLRQSTTANCRYLCTSKMIAICLSHMKVWELMLIKNEDNIIVCEDDVEPNANFTNVFAMTAPSNFDMIFLGCFGCTPAKRGWLFNAYSAVVGKRKTATSMQHLMSMDKSSLYVSDFQMGTHCYVLSKQGAKKLLDYFTNQINNHVDVQIQRLNATGRLNVYKVYPFLVSQTSSNGDPAMFPKLLNSTLARFEIENGVSVPFCFSMPCFELLGFPVTFYSGLFFAMGFFCRHLAVKPTTLFVLLILIFSTDTDMRCILGTTVACFLGVLVSDIFMRRPGASTR